MHFVNAKGILSAKNGMNIYRGCTHGCIYCDSRSKCYNMQHGFEDIEIKQNAPELLENALRRKKARCMIGTGAMCDPYLHCEKQLGLTRKCIEIIDKYGFGLCIQTKSDLVLRDLDLLVSINEKSKCVVQMTLTTYDEELCRAIEPKVCTTKQRFEVLKTLQKNGIPTVVWISPVLPFINDTAENLNGILDYCFAAGVKGIICFGIGTTMREGSREYFYEALDREFKGLKQKYINTYGNSYNCPSVNNDFLMKLFHQRCRENGVLHTPESVFSYLYEYCDKTAAEQLSLF